MEPNSACRLVTVSFPRQFLPLAEGHKDLIVIWPLVPWAEWPLIRAKPNRERMKFHCSAPPHSQHSTEWLRIFPSALYTSQRTLTPAILLSATLVYKVEKSGSAKHILGSSRRSVPWGFAQAHRAGPRRVEMKTLNSTFGPRLPTLSAASSWLRGVGRGLSSQSPLVH